MGKLRLVLVYFCLDFPDSCEGCGGSFDGDEQRLGVLQRRQVAAGDALSAAVSLADVCRPSSYHVRCAPPPGTPGRVIGGVQGRRARKDSHGPEHFAEVAQVYRDALACQVPSPTRQIALRFNVSRSTAAKWVSEARRRGLLGPTRQGVAGA